MQRTKDSTWNYDFILDYFASPLHRKKKQAHRSQPKKVDLKNVRFIKNDLLGGRIDGSICKAVFC
jgi:hypothetical protein